MIEFTKEGLEKLISEHKELLSQFKEECNCKKQLEKTIENEERLLQSLK